MQNTGNPQDLKPLIDVVTKQTETMQSMMDKMGAGDKKSGGIFDFFKDKNGEGGGFLQAIATSQPNLLKSYNEQEFFGLSKGVDAISNILNPVKDIKLLFQQSLEFLREQSEITNTINGSMNLMGSLADDVKNNIQDTLPGAIQVGYGIKDMTDLYTRLNAETGRFNIISKDTLKDSLYTAKAFFDNLGDLGKAFSSFERIGIGNRDTLDTINKIGSKSISLGLTAKQTMKDIDTNLEKINTYGFKNGVESLAEMSRTAKMFRMDMQAAFTVADKVMDPAKAIELSANLQVLGGALGDFANPLKLMYDSTNDVNGLQKSIIEAAKSLATYNVQQGKFEITGMNIRRVREMADITGVSVKDLTQGAIAAQEKMAGLQQLMGGGFTGNEDDKQFLLNLAHMEHGQMMITIPENLRDQFKDLPNNVNEIAFNQIGKYQDTIMKLREDFKDKSPTEIAKSQLTELQRIDNNIGAVAAYYRNRLGETLKGSGGGVENQFQKFLHSADLKVNDLMKYADSGVKFTQDTKDAVKKITDTYLSGAYGKAQSLVDELDQKLGLDKKFVNASPVNPFTNKTVEREQDVKEGIKNTTTNNQTSNTNTVPEKQTIDINVNHSFGPTDSVSNTIYRETIKNHGIRDQLQATPDKKSFNYIDAAKNSGKH